jgi:PAS domain S-box-containing protein
MQQARMAREPDPAPGDAVQEEPSVLGPLQLAVDEAARLLHADGAIAYLLQPDGQTLRWAADAGIISAEDRGWMRSLVLPVGVGMYGRAVEERAVRVTDDYPSDQTFRHAWMTDQVVRNTSIRSMVAAPLLVGDQVLGAIGVYSTRKGAFGEPDATLIRALAGHAAASIANARLIEQLARSREESARRADQERTLREITGRIAVLGEPHTVLQLLVEEARRLLAADGAHLCLLSESGDYLEPTVLAGPLDAPLQQFREWQFPVGGGMNGLAAKVGQPVWTSDYRADPRIPHEAEDDEVAELMGLRAMAVAPLRSHGRGVIGTLAISHREPRDMRVTDIEVLKGLADVAAIAVSNSRLYEQLRRSEEKYEYLLRNSPDVAFSMDRDGNFTFISDVIERIVGMPASAALGRQFSELVHADAKVRAEAGWAEISTPPYPDQEFRFLVRARKGGPVPVAVRAIAMIEDGKFVGAHGLIRDLRDQVRIEADMGRQAAELASAQERARLAQELHDSVTQALFSMTLTTRSVELLVERDPAAARKMLTELRDLEREALAEMRALIFELRPANIEEDGLTQALRTHAAGVQARSGLPISVDCSVSDERPPLEVESALYRIAQEALHNVVKHASASQARIEIRETDDELSLTVEDDGTGFDPAEVPTGHLGLAGMRTRAEQIGARVAVTSGQGKGTRIQVAVPRLAREPAPAAAVARE